MSIEDESNGAAPSWVASQTPKLDLPHPSDDVTPLPKTKRKRRTKAEILADAEARVAYSPVEELPIVADETSSASTVNIDLEAVAKALPVALPSETWLDKTYSHAAILIALVALLVAVWK